MDLHKDMNITISGFSKFTDLAKSISTQPEQKFRLAPSEYGKLQISNFHFAVMFYAKPTCC